VQEAIREEETQGIMHSARVINNVSRQSRTVGV